MSQKKSKIHDESLPIIYISCEKVYCLIILQIKKNPLNIDPENSRNLNYSSDIKKMFLLLTLFITI